MWCQEQKNVVCPKYLITKFKKAGEIVVDWCAGAFSAAWACMLLPKHRLFVACDDDSAAVEVARPAVDLKYSTQLLKYGSNITANDYVMSAARVQKEQIERLNESHFVNKWSTRGGLVSMQTFRIILHPASSSTTGNATFTDRVGNVPTTYNLWSQKWRSRLRSTEMHKFHSVECETLEVGFRESTIQHNTAGRDSLPTKELGRNRQRGISM